VALKYYRTPAEAIESVRNADTYSAIVLSKNFSNVLKHFGTGGGGGGGPLGLGGLSVQHQLQTLAASLASDGLLVGGSTATPTSTNSNIRSIPMPNTPSGSSATTVPTGLARRKNRTA